MTEPLTREQLILQRAIVDRIRIAIMNGNEEFRFSDKEITRAFGVFATDDLFDALGTGWKPTRWDDEVVLICNASREAATGNLDHWLRRADAKLNSPWAKFS